MHEPGCEDWQEHWPQGHTTVDVSTLGTSGTGNPLRVSVERGPAPWLGIWSDQNGIAGLLIGKSSTDQFPMDEGGVIPYPEGADLFLTKATGGAGICHFARFRTERDARNWTRANATALRGGGSGFGPFPTATVIPNQNDPLPTTTRIGSATQLYNSTASKLDLWRGEGWNADNSGIPLWGIGNVQAWLQVLSDRTGNNSQMRQPNASAPKMVLQSAISTASTGVKATRTMAQDGYIRWASVTPISGTPNAAQIALQIVRSAVTYSIGSVTIPAAGTFRSYPLAFDFVAGGAQGGPALGAPVVAGDVVQANILAPSAACTADFALGFEENRNNV